MTSDDVVKCPLCEGHGQLERPEMLARLGDVELAQKLEHYRETIAEQVTALAGERPVRDFQKEVHNWNPQLPMWRRSPKE